MNGIFPTILRVGVWTVEVDEDMIVILAKKKVDLKNANQYHLRINSKRNNAGLCRSIFHLEDQEKKIINSVCLLQYHIDKPDCEKVKFTILPHGNRKHGSNPYYPTQPSVLHKIKDGVSTSNNASSTVYSKLIKEAGGYLNARQPSELPRGKRQVYTMKAKVNQGKQDEDLLAYLRQLEEPVILQHHDVPEDLWIFGTPQMCKDLDRFCTSDLYSYPLSVDPTFNFGTFDVTPFVYRHLFLERKRTGTHPVFLGPTALHHSKTEATYRRIITAVTDNCKTLKEKCRGYMTDGESPLIKALSATLPKATGLRCFVHFTKNCKAKLHSLGIHKRREQKVFLNKVFGSPDSPGGVFDAEDKADMKQQIKSLKEEMSTMERKFLKKGEDYESQFWKYLFVNRKMMAKCMGAKSRREAGMPIDNDGRPQRSYTNQSESINNMLTRQTEAVTGKVKKGNQTKLEFVRDSWFAILANQEHEIQLALCGQSEEFQLTEQARYLEVDAGVWFDWSPKQRLEYTKKFGELTVQDIFAGKEIKISAMEEDDDSQQFSFDLQQELVRSLKLKEDLAKVIYTESVKLLKSSTAVQLKPSLGDEKVKYLVAAKQCKKGMYECTVNKNHVTCSCGAYKYNNVCKHSLVVAEKNKLLRQHLDFVAKSPRLAKPLPSGLVTPAPEASGRKGGRFKTPWRPARQSKNKKIAQPIRPYTEIHHNDNPLNVVFLTDAPKADACRQCGNHFPRRKKTPPFDIVLSHKEKWLYTDKEDGRKKKSAYFTIKYYCIRRSCITTRFPYFDSSYIEISEACWDKMEQLHLDLLRDELDYLEEPQS